jgi:hypothetical protein
MKKILFFLLLAAFTSCQEKIDTPNEEAEETPTPEPPKPIEITGVWRDGDFFISFDANGYYSAHLSEEHLDTGAYSIEDNIVTCKNNYNAKTTTYDISEANETTIRCKATYSPYNAEAKTESRTFTKTDETPNSKDHILIDKYWGYKSKGYGTITIEFKNHYLAFKSSSVDDRYVNEWYYAYIEPYIYVQSFTPNDGRQHPTNSFTSGNDTGVVEKKKVSLDEGRLIGVTSE